MEKEQKNDVNFEQSDENQTVGDILRHARLKQGKTLNDVAEKLYIRRAYLEAIENAEYKKLPVEPYGLGYVRNYADYLGLNSARIVQSFKETAMPKVMAKKNIKAVGDEPENSAPGFGHIISGLILLFVAILLWNFYGQYSQEQNIEIVNDTPQADNYPVSAIVEEEIAQEETSASGAENNEENSITEEISEQTEISEELVVGAPAEESTEIVENKPRIRLEVTGDSWIDLKHGDEVLLAKVYGKGFEYEVPYNDNLEISVGKRSNVKFYIDGKLTEVTAPGRQMRIKLDEFLENR